MSSQSDRIFYSGRVNDLVYFEEPFEARMHSLKLGIVLTGDATHEDYMPTDKNGATKEQRTQSVNN